MRKISGSPFPTKAQELLLQASLLKDSRMQKAWMEWKSLVDFEEDIHYASFRMLPLLYSNLHKHGVEDALMPRLKGIYRQSWSKNHLLFHKTGSVLKLMHSHGVPTILLKGIALSILVYKNNAVRPMADMDLLIPKNYARQTLAFLKENHWQIQDEQYLEYNLKYGRSVSFINKNKTELDLHWHPIFEAHDNITDKDFWDFAVPLEVAGEKTKAFCASDNLFHAIVHGMRYNPEPPIRWVADAMTLVHSTDQNINWERLLHHTKKFRVHLQMKEALNYLIQNFDAPIPHPFMQKLEQIKPTFIDRLVYKHAKKYGDAPPASLYQKLYAIYAGYLRQSSENSLWTLHIGFIKYLRFRTKGKPYFKILIYYISLLFKNNSSKKQR